MIIDLLIPEKYFISYANNPKTEKILITCNYPTNYPELAEAISAKFISRLTQQETIINNLNEEINKLKSENFELAQGTAIQAIFEKIEEMERKWNEYIALIKAPKTI